jgi:hypothetical protein
MVCTSYILFEGIGQGFSYSLCFLAGLMCCYGRLSLVLRYMRERFANCVHFARNVICDCVLTPCCVIIL